MPRLSCMRLAGLGFVLAAVIYFEFRINEAEAQVTPNAASSAPSSAPSQSPVRVRLSQTPAGENAHVVTLAPSTATSSAPASQPASQPRTPAAAAFERLKSVVGIWELEDAPVATSEGMTEFITVIRTVAGGSALVQTDFPGVKSRENVTVFHVDGPDALMATHYCPLGSQPRMRATRFEDPERISFVFHDGTNLDPEKDRHCHNLMVTFVDAEHFREDWTFFVDGQQHHIKTFSWKKKSDLPGR